MNGAPTVVESQAWPSGSPWRWLQDDGRRYFADPFLFRENGTTHVFCEEFPYATAKGVISVFTLDAAGRPSAPRVVLEQPYHLSYPQVFRHDGKIWMMPESSANRTLELYVAESFPDRWKLHSVLLADLSLSDATAFEHDGRWWLTATTNEPDTSTWDCLSLFYEPVARRPMDSQRGFARSGRRVRGSAGGPDRASRRRLVATGAGLHARLRFRTSALPHR